MYLALGRRFAGQLFCFYRNRFAAQISVLHPEPFEEDFSQMVAGLLMQYCPFFGNFLKGMLLLFCFVVFFILLSFCFVCFYPPFRFSRTSFFSGITVCHMQMPELLCLAILMWNMFLQVWWLAFCLFVLFCFGFCLLNFQLLLARWHPCRCLVQVRP